MGNYSLSLFACERLPRPRSKPKKAMHAHIVIFKSIRLSTFYKLSVFIRGYISIPIPLTNSSLHHSCTSPHPTPQHNNPLPLLPQPHNPPNAPPNNPLPPLRHPRPRPQRPPPRHPQSKHRPRRFRRLRPLAPRRSNPRPKRRRARLRHRPLPAHARPRSGGGARRGDVC